MATISNIEKQGSLIRWELDPGDTRFPVRTLYMAREFVTWLDEVLPDEQIDRGRDITPYEQVAVMFDQFVGEPSFRGVGDFVLLRPQCDGVYEMKVTDVRVFGWFPQKRTFVAVSGEMKKRLKGNGRLVGSHVRKAAALRTKLGLDFLKGNMHELL